MSKRPRPPTWPRTRRASTAATRTRWPSSALIAASWKNASRPIEPATTRGPSGRCAEQALALLGLAAGEELAPVVGLNFDVVLLGCCLDALPGPVAVGVGDVLDLVEASDRVTHVLGVGQRLLALLSEGELRLRQLVLLGRADAGRPTRAP